MASNVRFLDQVLINPVGETGGGGSNIVDGAPNYIVKFKDANTLTTSSIYEDSDSGNIGIGTLSPINTLEINGGLTATSLTASIISASSGITGSLFGTASWALNALTSSFLPVGTYNITSSWAQSASNAINAQTASFIASTSNAFIQNGNLFGTTAVLGTNDTQNLQFETNGSTRMTISSSGLIGINTTTPAFTLDINGSLRTIGGATVNSLTSVGNISSSAGIVIAGGANFDSAQVNNVLIVGDGSDTTTAFAIIKNLYTSKEATATGRDMLLDSEVISEDNKKTVFKVIDNTTSVSSSIMTLTSEQRVGIGVDNPTAKFQVVGSTLISGSSTFSGSISQQSIFTASFGYLIASSSLITGNSTINGSIYIIQKASIGTTHQSASLTISASSAENAVLVKINDVNVTDKFKINNEGVIVLGSLDNTPTAIEGGIFFSSSNDYFFGFS